jgi:glycosyltransferase involved in cell wall biosynthesis
MDSQHPVLSHQVEAIVALSSEFDEITVVTGQVGSYSVPSNVHVLSTNWTNHQPLRNSLKYLRVVLPQIFSGNFSAIFSHMTEVQSSLIAPLTKLLGISHYLWYAHAFRSKYLVWCHFWLTGIITSTSGSCPLKSTKVHPIGQAIDAEEFKFLARPRNELVKFVHIGRFDPSKNIESIIDAIIEIRLSRGEVSLALIGSPSTKLAELEAEKIRAKFRSAIEEGWLQFIDSIPRKSVMSYLTDSHVFIHSYIGSLDKSLIEATMMGIPVVTTNAEYIETFGTWSNEKPISLINEVESLLTYPPEEIDLVLQNRRIVCADSHSLSHWTAVLSQILR